MKYIIRTGNKEIAVSIPELSSNSQQSQIQIGRRSIDIDFRKLKDGLHSLIMNNRCYESTIEKNNGAYEIWHARGFSSVEVIDEKAARLQSLMGTSDKGTRLSFLRAPMPGMVLKVEVEIGQHVKKGDGLVIVEAMKMENELKATAAGVVKEIKVQPRQSIEKNQVLLIFE